MAKLKAPLLSLGASQQLGKSIVFFGWKGLDCVREYVIPANPKTALQTTQRSYLADAVAKIHEAQARATHPLDQDDQSAYSLLGSTRPTPRTWFNEAIKLWVDVKVAGKTPVIYSDGKENSTSRTALELAIFLNEETSSKLADGKFYLGKSKTNLVHTITATITAGDTAYNTAADISAWAAEGDKIFWQFRPDSGDSCEGANSGIYTFKAT